MDHKCPKCGVSAFQHWLLGFMHKCHVCGTIWKTHGAREGEVMHPDWKAMKSWREIEDALVANATGAVDCPEAFRKDLRDALKRKEQLLKEQSRGR